MGRRPTAKTRSSPRAWAWPSSPASRGDDPTNPRTIATPKHFAVHSGPEPARHRFNVTPSPHDLEDTYLPAFRATVTEGHAQSLMCAYNAVDGAPACANDLLLKKTLRGAWGFNGFVTSDCGAIGDIAKGHAFTSDLEHAAVAAVRAGTDINCGHEEYTYLVQAVHDGLIQESEIDTAVRRLFHARFELGMFDAPAQVAYARLPFNEVDSAPHRQLALQTARESMVLLKNVNNVLPLAHNIKTVAVVGPNAASLAALEGNYNAIPSHPVTPLDGLRDALHGHATVLYAQGSGYADGVMVPAPETLFAADGQHGPARRILFRRDPRRQARPHPPRPPDRLRLERPPRPRRARMPKASVCAGPAPSPPPRRATSASA